MLFNSWIFIFGFLPCVLVVYWGLHHAGKTQGALSFLVPVSFIFYAYWKPEFLLLLLISIGFNYAAGKYVASPRKGRKLIVGLAIAINLLLLAWFKYALFIAATLNNSVGTTFDPGNIFLPLGISFFTFHQITYLVDVYKKKITVPSLRNYALYVGFFPQLIAGPIVRAWEIIPQFENFSGREKFWQNMALGGGLFIMGLFKKVVIADSLALYATPIFALAEEGKQLTFFDGWSGTLAYTFQLYFDFSGYSDMAIGLALMLGFILPINFLSPYKTTSIVEFWHRWHMTMSRFFRDYLYIPLGGNRVSGVRQIFNLAFTMTLAGLWHGAGWTFAIWGLLHGVYLIINHIFTKLREKFFPTLDVTKIPYRILAHVLTMLAISTGWVFFRAESFAAAFEILKSMAGYNGIVLPQRIFAHLGVFETQGWLRIPAIGEQWIATSYGALLWIAAAYFLCLALPSSMEYFGLSKAKSRMKFSLNIKTALIISLMGIAALFSMQRISEFLYFQF